MKRLLSLLIVSMVCLQIFAVPANPNPVTVPQPNGEEVTLIMQGDEFINWAVTLDGYTLLVNSDFYWSYAQLDVFGDLKPSTFTATEIETRSPEVIAWLQTINKGLFYSEEQVYHYMQLREIIETETEKGDFTKATGEYKLLVILAQFPEGDGQTNQCTSQTPKRSMTKTQDDFNLLLNQIAYTTGKITGSMKDYYLETSYNKLDVQCSIVGPYTLQNCAQYYAYTAPNGSNPFYNTFARHSIAAAFEDGVDFSQFVTTGNRIPSVYIIYAGFDKSNGCASCIWAHAQQQFNYNYGGFIFQAYACSSELEGTAGTTMAGIGTICHEFGHALGAPDYYDTNYEIGGQYEGTGYWDIMASGTHNNGGNTPATHNPRTKVETYKWATAIELNTPQKVTVPIGRIYENAYFKINTSVSGEYFIIENKMREGSDIHIPGDNLLIYRCTEPYSANGNTTSPQRFYPVSANAPVAVPTSGSNSQSQYGSINAASASWPGSLKKTSFSNTSIPAMITWANQPVNKPITNIVVHGDYITFDFMGGGPKSNFHVFLPAYYGCMVTPQAGSISPVNAGGSFSFKVDLLPSHNKSDLKVTANNIELTPSGNVYTISGIQEDKIVRIEGLAFNSFPITATASANGVIVPEGIVSVNTGGIQSFEIMPENGCSIDKVVVDGENMGIINSYTFRNVLEPHTISAIFKLGGQYTINTSVDSLYFETYAGIPSQIQEVIISSPDVIANISAASTSVYFQISNNGNQWYSSFIIQRSQLPYKMYVRFYPRWWGDDGIFDGKITLKSTEAYKEIKLRGVSVLGIDDQDNDQGIVIYPNPTTGELRIRIADQARNDSELGIKGIEIFDVYGKKHDSTNAQKHEEEIVINISHLSAGMYFVQITTKTGTITKKVVKE